MVDYRYFMQRSTPVPTGEAHSRSKLTRTNVLKIHAAAREGVTLKQIACTFNVSPAQVRRILRGENWKGVFLELQGKSKS